MLPFRPETLRVSVPSKMPDLPKKKTRKRRKPSKKALRQKAEMQARNPDGTFKRLGGFLDNLFTRKKKKTLPLPQRSLGGKLKAAITGEATRYTRNQARRISPILKDEEPKRRKRRRRKTA